ncbi:putative leucine-rich repeat-containing protein DDB_G0290503 isoform X1 [Clytia hemisphaerica]|uniref:Uncharacterized protein n=1 Tax=Clytia hemisphaerica TaxID=252671 RepID=A0A7M5WRF4_9CNID
MPKGTAKPSAKKKEYSLPCVYCNNKVTFPSSEKLKEHLFSRHRSNICKQSHEPSSSYSIPSQTQPVQSQQTIQSQANTLLQQAPVIPPKPGGTTAHLKSSSTYNPPSQSSGSVTGHGVGAVGSIRFKNSITASILANSPKRALKQQQYQESSIYTNIGDDDDFDIPPSVSSLLSKPLSAPASMTKFTASTINEQAGNYRQSTSSINELPSNHRQLTSSVASKFLADGKLGHSRSTSDLDLMSGMQNRNMQRMVDSLTDRERENITLRHELESLKAESQVKDEEQTRVKQRWRKEAEDALRNLKTTLKDVTAQKRLLENQLSEVEKEKENFRAKSDHLEKKLADLQTEVASKQRDMQMYMQDKGASESPGPSAGATKKERDLARLLMADLQKLRQENEKLVDSITGKDDMIERMKTKLTAAQEASSKQPITKPCEKNHSNANPQEVFELKNVIKSYVGKNETLETVVKTLKIDKNKLLNRLQNADSQLTSLSNKITLSRSQPNLSSSTNLALGPATGGGGGSTMNQTTNSRPTMDQSQPALTALINNSLDQILGILKKLPPPCQHSQGPEVQHLTSDLQRVNLELVEEKSKVCQLRKIVQELEEVIENENDVLKERDQKTAEIQKLRAKIQLHENNEKVRKQLAKEKKLLQRKSSSMQKELKVINTLYQTSATDIAQKDNHILELLAERKRLIASNEKFAKDLTAVNTKCMECEKLVEKYKRESAFLVEKLNAGAKEREEMKQRNESLEARINEMASSNDMREIKTSLTDMQKTFNEIKMKSKNSTNVESKLTEDLQTVYRKNDELLNRITGLENQLYHEKENVLTLQKVVKEKETEINDLDTQMEEHKSQAEINASQSELHNNMNESKYESQIENLKLENEILQSRVMILEGISHEMDILTTERNNLKKENTQMRQRQSRTDKSEMVLVANMANDPESKEKVIQEMCKVSKLDENAKEKLQEMLSMPGFERFLSEDMSPINLMSDASSCATSKSSNSVKSLSRESVFEKEHTINHMYQASSDTLMAPEGSASFEDVIQVYHPPPTDDVDATVDYNGGTSLGPDSSIHQSQPSPGYVSQSQSNAGQTPYRQNNVKPSALPPQLQRQLEKAFDKSPSNVSLDSNMSAKLDRIFCESKALSGDIARGTSHENVNYKQVLSEFNKMISKMSGASINESTEDAAYSPVPTPTPSSRKRVTFSDHVVDFNQSENDTWSMSSTMSCQSKSTNDDKNQRDKEFFEALKKNFPSLSRHESSSAGAIPPKPESRRPDQQSPSVIPSPTKAPHSPRGQTSLTGQALNLMKAEKSFIKTETSNTMASFDNFVQLLSKFETQPGITSSSPMIQSKLVESNQSTDQALSAMLSAYHEEVGERQLNLSSPGNGASNLASPLLNGSLNSSGGMSQDSKLPVTPKNFLKNYQPLENVEYNPQLVGLANQLFQDDSYNGLPVQDVNHTRLLENTSFDGLREGVVYEPKLRPQLNNPRLYSRSSTPSGQSNSPSSNQPPNFSTSLLHQ